MKFYCLLAVVVVMQTPGVYGATANTTNEMIWRPIISLERIMSTVVLLVELGFKGQRGRRQAGDHSFTFSTTVQQNTIGWYFPLFI